MKYRSIVISGLVATGTSTAAKNLSKKLKIPYKSAGDFYRSYVLKHNIPIYAHDKFPDELDIKIDTEFSALTDKNEGIILDSHFAGYMNRNKPHVLKVLLVCEEAQRTNRALARTHTHTETAEGIKEREKQIDAKFRKLYSNEDHLNPKFFDLVIDTTKTSPEEVTGKIIIKFRD